MCSEEKRLTGEFTPKVQCLINSCIRENRANEVGVYDQVSPSRNFTDFRETCSFKMKELVKCQAQGMKMKGNLHI